LNLFSPGLCMLRSAYEIGMKFLLSVDKAEMVQVRFTLCLRDQRMEYGRARRM